VTGVATLLHHSLRRWRVLLGVIVCVLVAFQFFVIFAARSLELSGRFKFIEAVLPSFMTQWTNMMAATFTGFVLFGYSHPTVQLFLVAMAIAIGSEPAAEIDMRFVDLMMARPLARAVPIVRTILLLILASAAAVGCMVVATVIGLSAFAPATARAPSLRTVLSLAANLEMLVLAWGGIALALACLSKRRSTATATCGLLAFATFVLDYVGRFWDPVAPISRVSPFHYFDPFAMTGGRPLAASDILTLFAIFVGGAGIAHVAYHRRDL
jgi:hypothetical protein